ncbi:ead/Ea22-like family protein [Citrobacter freundii]|nr:ead/Ea22-like family protein [Citrobacter freundii]MCW1446951.1 ead/Ea22-like family protein [Citrobacter freundii]
MTALNKQALREAAEKATQGPWIETCGEVTTADYDIEGVTFLDHICNCEIIGTESPNAEFIAAANPATVLALLDELEAAEKRIAELDASHSRLRDTMATIHNTIRMDGGYTPLAAILNAAKRAHEESAIAAGIGVKGE